MVEDKSKGFAYDGSKELLSTMDFGTVRDGDKASCPDRLVQAKG